MTALYRTGKRREGEACGTTSPHRFPLDYIEHLGGIATYDLRPLLRLQFLSCPDNAVGQALITDPRTAAAILTGSIKTARLFQDWRPDLPLFAEISGKNALIVTAMADRDQAIKDLVRSAFGHNGQKCSAASLGILKPRSMTIRHSAASCKTLSPAWPSDQPGI
jgi:acyl-CoA reductase-like NAD-dependent aldehyde dehydrogenase